MAGLHGIESPTEKATDPLMVVIRSHSVKRRVRLVVLRDDRFAATGALTVCDWFVRSTNDAFLLRLFLRLGLRGLVSCVLFILICVVCNILQLHVSAMLTPTCATYPLH